MLPPANDYRAAWSGTRIILQQTSPEANDIFDLIIALYIACDGNWQALQKLTGISRDEISADADDMPEDVVKDQGELVNIEDVVEDSNPGPSKFIPVNIPEEPAVLTTRHQKERQTPPLELAK